MYGPIVLARRRLLNAAVRTGLTLAPDPATLDPTRALRDAARAERILFLCLGNICRSPMAERYARHALAERGVDDVAVDSAGFVSSQGRTSPEDAVAVAREFDVDLADHRSTRLTREALDASDVVFVMDVRNFRDLRSTFDGVGPPVYFLGPLTDGADDGFEIPDPHGGDRETFHHAFADVSEAIDTLAPAVARREEA